MDRLFRDWRFALMWAIGIGALAAAYASDYGAVPQVVSKPPVQAQIPVRPKLGAAAQSAPLEDKASGFDEPVTDTAPLDPGPAVESSQVPASPVPDAPAAVATGGTGQASAPAPAVP